MPQNGGRVGFSDTFSSPATTPAKNPVRSLDNSSRASTHVVLSYPTGRHIPSAKHRWPVRVG